MVNHYEAHVIIRYNEHQLQENFLDHFLHYRFFYEFFIKLRSIFYSLKLFTESVCDIAQPFKLFTS